MGIFQQFTIGGRGYTRPTDKVKTRPEMASSERWIRGARVRCAAWLELGAKTEGGTNLFELKYFDRGRNLTTDRVVDSKRTSERVGYLSSLYQAS